MTTDSDKEIIFDYLEGKSGLDEFLTWIHSRSWFSKFLIKPEYEKGLEKTRNKESLDIDFFRELFNHDFSLHIAYSKYLIKNVKKPDLSQCMIKLFEFYYGIIDSDTFSNYFDNNLDTFFSKIGYDLAIEIFDSINKVSNDWYKTIIEKKLSNLLDDKNAKRYFYTRSFKIYLSGIINETDTDMIKYCRLLTSLQRVTYIVPIVYVGYDSELDDPGNIKYYKNDIINTSKELLLYIEECGF